ncbi:hypothetical protein J7384_19115 [Endozoicomonas sp. G2_1]|uniref:hypothetical protein n=1 Tax=Endozoicomonas sp. G2_1 TaxID=2821091 RepID=UPI001ADBE75B|nr:hypothetical protein [Endozoicomonas sp. G2_1]MBO9492466.1 hypothetical protein [Endozoicomonas sp. G2_1]
MNEARIVKKWKSVEAQLNLAATLLDDPTLFVLAEQEFAEYRFNTRELELLEAFERLEKIARNSGCKSGFWRSFQKVSTILGFDEKTEQFEEEFHRALSKNIKR